MCPKSGIMGLGVPTTPPKKHETEYLSIIEKVSAVNLLRDLDFDFSLGLGFSCGFSVASNQWCRRSKMMSIRVMNFLQAKRYYCVVLRAARSQNDPKVLMQRVSLGTAI